MRKILLIAISLLCVCATAFSQTAVSGSKVFDNTGNLLTSGQWCFGATCLTVTNGVFSGSVTAGTQTVTVVNGGTTYLTVSGVVIGSSAFNWNTFVVPTNASISGMGTPYLGCFPGSTYTQTDLGNKVWSCVPVNGANVWLVTNPPSPAPGGLYAGTGTPSFTCAAPCAYIQSDASSQSQAFWAIVARPGVSSTNWQLQGGNGTFAAGGDLSGSGTVQQVIGIKSVPFCSGFTPTNLQFLQYTTGGTPNPCYTAAPASGSFTAAGDLSGSGSSQQVIGIQGHALPTLTSGYPHWTGSAWVYDTPSGAFSALSGDATSTSSGGATTVVGINGTLLSGLATGLMKVTTATGAVSSVAAPVGTIVGTTDTQTLTNKTVDGVTPATMAFLDATSSVQTQLNGKQATLTNPVTGPGTGATAGHIAVCNNAGCTLIADGGVAIPTFPTGAIVGTSDTQTLTNKSIAGSEINSGTVSATVLPTATAAAKGVVQVDGTTITISGGIISATTGGSGNVNGPVSATANDFASFSDATGKALADSGKNANSFAPAPGNIVPVSTAVNPAVCGTWYNATATLTVTLPTGTTGCAINVTVQGSSVTATVSSGSANIAQANNALASSITVASPQQVTIGWDGTDWRVTSSSLQQVSAGMSQDCTMNASGVMTCTKTNNVAFAASATTDTTNASNINSGTLGAVRLQGITGCSTANLFLVPSGSACRALASGDIPNNAANTSGSAASLSAASSLPSGTTATTQSAGDNSTKVSTTAYVDAHVVNTVKDTSSPVTVTTTLAAEYHFNQDATAATAITYNLPTAAAGKQFCFANSYNGSAADTGVLTIQTSATGQFIIFTDGTLSATDGNVTSGGAAADAACVVGVDATHWQLYVQAGTWTKH